MKGLDRIRMRRREIENYNNESTVAKRLDTLTLQLPHLISEISGHQINKDQASRAVDQRLWADLFIKLPR